MTTSTSGAAAGGGGQRAPVSAVWLEKYRPRSFAECVGNPGPLERLRAIVTEIKEGRQQNLHLLLTGPPGCGKTTSALVLMREMIGEDKVKLKEAVLELNASDDRGIDTVRASIKNFVRAHVNLPAGAFKLVILDEVDSMTTAAQNALRCIMEEYAASTRFALACNQSSKIIDPIQSRCAILRFARITDQQVEERLKKVLDIENVPYNQEGVDSLVFFAEGDMRAALNNAQACFNAAGKIGKEEVYEVCDMPHPEKIKEAMVACWKEKNHFKAWGNLKVIYDQGHTQQDILGMMFRQLKADQDCPEHKKLAFIRLLGEFHMRLGQGVASALQVESLIAKLVQKAAELDTQ